MPDGSIFRGPVSGYQSDAKQEYRDSIWRILSKHAREAIISDDRMYALLLPSSNGLEIDTAIRHGIPENKIIAIDENPALIAASKWRKIHPKVKFYGCRLSALPAKLIRDKRIIAAANLDLCNNFSDELINELTTIKKIPRWDELVYAVTIAKGRESSALTYLMKEGGIGADCLKEPRMRCAAVCASFPSNTVVIEQGKYINNKHPMAWAIFKTDPSASKYSESVQKRLEICVRHARLADEERCRLLEEAAKEAIHGRRRDNTGFHLAQRRYQLWMRAAENLLMRAENSAIPNGAICRKAFQEHHRTDLRAIHEYAKVYSKSWNMRWIY